ncbi:indole-3-acetic acid-amido synthetase GH3.10 [Tanacetum coccineum]
MGLSICRMVMEISMKSVTWMGKNWESLLYICNDLSNGTLSPRITLPCIRKSVVDLIKPDLCLAKCIRSKCEELEQSGWYGLIPKLWPNAKYVYSIMTGSMLPYLEKLKHYSGDHLPLVSAEYGSTESWIGVNMDPSFNAQDVTFVVVPTFSYFEFIPLHLQHHKACDHMVSNVVAGDVDYLEDDPVPLSKVEIGKQYEIVLTTFTGVVANLCEVSGRNDNSNMLKSHLQQMLFLWPISKTAVPSSLTVGPQPITPD